MNPDYRKIDTIHIAFISIASGIIGEHFHDFFLGIGIGLLAYVFYKAITRGK